MCRPEARQAFRQRTAAGFVAPSKGGIEISVRLNPHQEARPSRQDAPVRERQGRACDVSAPWAGGEKSVVVVVRWIDHEGAVAPAKAGVDGQIRIQPGDLRHGKGGSAVALTNRRGRDQNAAVREGGQVARSHPVRQPDSGSERAIGQENTNPSASDHQLSAIGKPFHIGRCAQLFWKPDVAVLVEGLVQIALRCQPQRELPLQSPADRDDPALVIGQHGCVGSGSEAGQCQRAKTGREQPMTAARPAERAGPPHTPMKPPGQGKSR